MDSHCPELFQQFSVVYIVEESLNVYVYDIMEIASLHILMNLSDCVLLVPVRAAVPYGPRPPYFMKKEVVLCWHRKPGV